MWPRRSGQDSRRERGEDRPADGGHTVGLAENINCPASGQVLVPSARPRVIAFLADRDLSAKEVPDPPPPRAKTPLAVRQVVQVVVRSGVRAGPQVLPVCSIDDLDFRRDSVRYGDVGVRARFDVLDDIGHLAW